MTAPSVRPALIGALLAGLLVPLAAAPAAHAAPDQAAIIMDDDLLLYRGDDTRDQAMRKMKELGADMVRVTVLWEVVAENARPTRSDIARLKTRRERLRALRQARRFRADDPRTYPKYNWDRYDRLVRAARTLGLETYFNVTFPGPAWAHEKPPASARRDARTWKPRPREFQKFVKAVGKRYNGRFRDENDERQLLPKVSVWSIGNEPNQGGWLTPQWERNRYGQMVPASPRLYRELYLRGRQSLVQTGHGRDVIMLGETAPLGSPKRSSRAPLTPKRFVSELLCVDPQGREYAGGAARARDCAIFERLGPLRTTGFAHHPYTKNVSPLQRPTDPEWFTMANLGELTGLLDRLAGTTGNLQAGLPLYLTEFGFETSPPDPISGVSLEAQALWLQLGDLLAWLNPRVKGQTQFLLADVRPQRRSARTGRAYKRNSKAYWFTYQSGLRFANGTPKPAQHAWTFPFLAYPAAADAAGVPQIAVWGQAKFLPDGAQQVQIQFRPADGSTDWRDHGAPLTTSAKGFFLGHLPKPGPGKWRAVAAGVPSRDFPVG